MAKSGGFAETGGAFAVASATNQVVTSLGTDGRLLIPAAIRDAASTQRGEKVRMRVEDGRIVISGIKADWVGLPAIA
ncbi:MAG: AbrB/MazE/SpoVT family DNA-binding domain-containing protein, partial [Pseudorhodobacter sp.]|nr:AbrB/MazE/SpoVT family DNA-binding domain-containing protein [Pseudorhodobacter sp.]